MERATLTVPEAAKVLGVSRPTMYDLANSEGFPTIHLGRKLVILREGFELWMREKAGVGS